MLIFVEKACHWIGKRTSIFVCVSQVTFTIVSIALVIWFFPVRCKIQVKPSVVLERVKNTGCDPYGDIFEREEIIFIYNHINVLIIRDEISMLLINSLNPKNI